MDPKFARVPATVWRHVAPLLPPEPPKPKGGRPRVPARVVFAGILYRLRTGCQWHALPQEFGSGSTCHARFQAWTQAGVFRQLWVNALKQYDRRRGIAWRWPALDGFLVKAPKGGIRPGRIPPIAVNAGRNGARWSMVGASR